MLLQTTPLRVSQLSFLRTSLLSFFLFLFCHLTYAGKKEAELDPPPPFPQSIQAKVYLGETVDIALEAIGRDAKEAIFLLRTKPKFGKLQNLRSIEPGKALITYTHQKPAPSGTDEFLYAVKSPKSPVSAPAKVTIHIVQRPPEPIIPNSLDLGVVYVGSNLTAFLRIENHGGSPFVTTPSADPPFLLPTTQQIRIPPKSFYDLQVFYEPKTEEEFLGSIRFSHDPSAQTLVKANAKLPFRVTPRELTIPQPNGKAKLLIENRTPSSLSFEVELPPVLRSTSTLLIPPYSDKFLEIEAACSSGAESTGNITLTALNHSLRIPFHLLPSPPIIHVLPSQNLNFGQVFPQNSTTLTFSLRNSGGAPAQISIQTPSWLPVHGPSDLLLQPQETKEIHLSFDPTHVGLHEGKIHIHGSEEPLTIHVQATAPPPAPPTFPTQNAFADASSPHPTPPPHNPFLLGELQPLNSQKTDFQLQNFRILAITTNSILMDWQQSIPTGGRIELQVRSVEITPGNPPNIVWQKIPNAEIAPTTDNRVCALIHSLPPGVRIFFRVAVFNTHNYLISTSDLFSAETDLPPAPKPFPWIWLFLLLCLAAILLALFLLRRNKAHSTLELEQKIKNLDKI